MNDVLEIDPPIVVTEEQAAILLQVTRFALRKWRRQGGGPRFIRCGSRLIRYLKRDIDEWLKENSFRNSSHELKERTKQ